MRGKWAGSAPRLFRRFRGRIGGLCLLLDRLGLGDRLLDVFQRQIELIGVQLGQPLALASKPCALRNRRRRRSLSSISLSRSAIAASRSAMAFNANARSASTSSGGESIGRFTRQAQHIAGDL